MSELMGIARFKFHPGKVEEFKRLSEECMEIVRAKEPGTLQYDIFFNDDESEAIVIERYRDSEAGMQHSVNIGEERMGRAIACGEIYGEILGRATPELRANVEGAPIQLFTPWLTLRGD